MKQNKSERINTRQNYAENLKITRDPVTQYPMVEFFNQQVVLQKGTTVRDLQEKPLEQVMECVL